MRTLILFFLVFYYCGNCFCQLTVTTHPSTAQFINQIQGSGVQISNVQVYCDSNAYGLFQGTSEIQMQDGLALTTGYLPEIAGPASFIADSALNHPNLTGWSELTNYYPTATRDYCRISFTLVPTGNSLKLGFVFGSDEYQGMHGNDMGDVYLTGQNPSGGQYDTLNISWIGTGNFPACIFNVSWAVWQAYFIDNNGGQYCTYSGLTTYIEHSTPVSPGQPYYVSISVADDQDSLKDTGIFIKDFSSDSVPLGIDSNQNLVFSPQAEMILFDISGREIWSGSPFDFPAIRSGVPSGVYVLTVMEKDGKMTQEKIAIIH